MESPPRDGQVSAEQTGSSLVSRATELPDCEPRRFLAGRDAPRTYWTSPYGPEFAGGGTTARVAADGDDRFAAVADAADDLFDGLDYVGPEQARPRLFGGFSFHADHDPAPPWQGFGGAEFVLPRTLLTRANGETWLTVSALDASPDAVERELAEVRDALADAIDGGDGDAVPGDGADDGGPPGVLATEPTTTREEWAEQVAAAVSRIEAGELRKVTLAQSLRVELAGDVSVPDALARLGESYPDCFRFCFEPTTEGAFFGATPERLATLRGRTVEADGLAGSIGRGATPEEDAELEASIENSEKMAHEHQLVVDTIRDQLAPLAGEVRVADRRVRKLATIQHLWTPIEADLTESDHVLSIVEALHPTPAVGGLPPETALRTIRETETFDRGWYAAPVGWFDADGDGTFAVGLRCAVTGESSATLYAGNGIVADSDPDEEYEEVQLKYRPILDELEDE
ncbi:MULTISPECIES: isochorismate synthase MenF [Halorussus]|uniref:isochorismate synthase n=1 Tax=Halorussus TaxID=1070314 RepID=UPI000E2164B3|nr:MULTISPECIES: isochorismate synthase [Halorussus]NHN58631.1 isochorismate synthase [Halorussus sp. JP-T4]